jgi:hypothetical protein
LAETYLQYLPSTSAMTNRREPQNLWCNIPEVDSNSAHAFGEYHSPVLHYPSPCVSTASNSPLGPPASPTLPSYQPSLPSDYSPSPPFYSDDPSPEPASCCDYSNDTRRKPSHPLVSRRASLAHPYARIYGKKEPSKRRKIWNHALEKSLFSPHEL